MTTSPSPIEPRHRRAFTLIELLLVISIISIILGMLVSTVRAVRRFSRQTITRGEIKNIEAAWKQFYTHYQYWPNAKFIGGVPRTPDVNGDAEYELLAPLARMLAGSNITDIVGDPGGITTYNADKIAFLELSRFNDQADPVNAWGRDHTISGLGKTPNTYVVIFDADGDNQITVSLPALPGEPATNIVLFRSVAVWTENPEYSVGTAASGGPQRYFGSWME